VGTGAEFPAVVSGRGARPVSSLGASTASGLGAGTGTWVAGSTPTGRLAGKGGGGPRLAKPGGRAGGKPEGGGCDSDPVTSTEFCFEMSEEWFVTVVVSMLAGFSGEVTSALFSRLVSLWFLVTAELWSPDPTL